MAKVLILDGIIYGGIAALGFAATENTLYIFRNGYQDSGWSGLFMLAFIRVVIVGWQHPFYTAFTGIGFAVARTNKNMFIKLIAPLVGYGIAVSTHAFHNTFGGMIGGLEGLAAGTFVDWIGWTIMLVFILWMIYNERNVVKNQLRSEVSSGLISPAQYQRALSPWTVTTANLSGKSTARFYQVCGELSHKKEQFTQQGDEGGNLAIIAKLRAELASLAPYVR